MNKMGSEILADEFLYGSIDKREFLKMYHDASADYGFLLINCNSVKHSDDLNLMYGILRCPEEYIK
jgi:hypothetical protein